MSNTGMVYLVGAGPGDPGLATIRARECLEQADVIVYDALANPQLLRYAPSEAERIYVGKKAGQHTMKQEDICQLLAEKARGGRCVVRLKGGDPFVFGRGGEEALVLREHGVPFEVVPGVTAAVAASAYAGIPVTHRTCNSVLTLVTGHEDPLKEESAIHWASLAAAGGTLVFYMGVKNLPNIAQRLTAEGMSPDTPVAVIQQGTLPAQRCVTGTLVDIADRVRGGGIRPPSLIVVGDVVTLREDLAWFDRRPLFGKTVVVTRSRTQASALARTLETLGAAVLLFPTIRIEPVEDDTPLREAARDLAGYDWVVFTSPNAVDAFFDAVRAGDGDARRLAACRVCSIGPGTGARLEANGVRPDLVPDRFTSKHLLEALRARGEVAGKRFLLPRADIAPPELPEGLRADGAEVVEIVAYRTLPGEPQADVLDALASGAVDIVTFTSSSTARNFAAIARDSQCRLPDSIAYASIGPETSKSARAEGFTVALEAPEHTVPGLVQAIVARFGKQ